MVKSGYLSPELKKITKNTFMILSNGAVNQDIASLRNDNRLISSLPFHKKTTFEPNARGKV